LPIPDSPADAAAFTYFEGLKESRLHRCVLIMERHLTEPLAHAAIAAELHISLRQLQRMCRHHLGMSLASLYMRLRMHYALWLLEHINHPVARVALDSDFARQFKAFPWVQPSYLGEIGIALESAKTTVSHPRSRAANVANSNIN
jgi:transcriptional regulator GlxA family with amidase domain